MEFFEVNSQPQACKEVNKIYNIAFIYIFPLAVEDIP